jgi:hypothetical protein
MQAPMWIARHGRAAQGTAAGVRARAMQRPHGHHTQSITRGTNVKIGRWGDGAGLERAAVRRIEVLNPNCCKLAADKEQNCGAARLMCLGDF